MTDDQKPNAVRVNDRTIRTEYSDKSGRIYRVNHAKNPNEAVKHCIGHLQEDSYPGATIAEIFDTETMELHAQIVKRMGSDEIVIAYKRDPMNYVVKGALESFRRFMAKQGVKV